MNPEPRLDPYARPSQPLRAMVGLETALAESGLEHSLYELVKIRASQLNGCAFCIHMHTRDARESGETEERIHLLPAWRESSLYSDRERAALGWTEALTRLSETHAPDDDWQAVRAELTDEEIVNLTLLIGAINVWNRLAVGLRLPHPRA